MKEEASRITYIFWFTFLICGYRCETEWSKPVQSVVNDDSGWVPVQGKCLTCKQKDLEAQSTNEQIGKVLIPPPSNVPGTQYKQPRAVPLGNFGNVPFANQDNKPHQLPTKLFPQDVQKQFYQFDNRFPQQQYNLPQKVPNFPLFGFPQPNFQIQNNPRFPASEPYPFTLPLKEPTTIKSTVNQPKIRFPENEQKIPQGQNEEIQLLYVPVETLQRGRNMKNTKDVPSQQFQQPHGFIPPQFNVQYTVPRPENQIFFPPPTFAHLSQIPPKFDNLNISQNILQPYFTVNGFYSPAAQQAPQQIHQQIPQQVQQQIQQQVQPQVPHQIQQQLQQQIQQQVPQQILQLQQGSQQTTQQVPLTTKAPEAQYFNFPPSTISTTKNLEPITQTTRRPEISQPDFIFDPHMQNGFVASNFPVENVDNVAPTDIRQPTSEPHVTSTQEFIRSTERTPETFSTPQYYQQTVTHTPQYYKPVQNDYQKHEEQNNYPVPHQPPLSFYMEKLHNSKVNDVLYLLKDAKTIPVLDTVETEPPSVFVGPTELQPPKGYIKFELPYLSSLDYNRIERMIDRLPFFVAPLNFKPPPGYSKIPFPAPHIGSVVLSNSTVMQESLHNKYEQKFKSPTTEPSKQFSAPPELSTITPQLTSQINSLVDITNQIGPKITINEISTKKPVYKNTYRTSTTTESPKRTVNRQRKPIYRGYPTTAETTAAPQEEQKLQEEVKPDYQFSTVPRIQEEIGQDYVQFNKFSQQQDLTQYSAGQKESNLPQFDAVPKQSDLSQYSTISQESDSSQYITLPKQSDTSQYSTLPKQSDSFQYSTLPKQSDLSQYSTIVDERTQNQVTSEAAFIVSTPDVNLVQTNETQQNELQFQTQKHPLSQQNYDYFSADQNYPFYRFGAENTTNHNDTQVAPETNYNTNFQNVKPLSQYNHYVEANDTDKPENNVDFWNQNQFYQANPSAVEYFSSTNYPTSTEDKVPTEAQEKIAEITSEDSLRITDRSTEVPSTTYRPKIKRPHPNRYLHKYTTEKHTDEISRSSDESEPSSTTDVTNIKYRRRRPTRPVSTTDEITEAPSTSRSVRTRPTRYPSSTERYRARRPTTTEGSWGYANVPSAVSNEIDKSKSDQIDKSKEIDHKVDDDRSVYEDDSKSESTAAHRNYWSEVSIHQSQSYEVIPTSTEVLIQDDPAAINNNETESKKTDTAPTDMIALDAEKSEDVNNITKLEDNRVYAQNEDKSTESYKDKFVSKDTVTDGQKKAYDPQDEKKNSGRRRGTWVRRVRIKRPQDVLETAESQNLGTLNDISSESKVQSKNAETEPKTKTTTEDVNRSKVVSEIQITTEHVDNKFYPNSENVNDRFHHVNEQDDKFHPTDEHGKTFHLADEHVDNKFHAVTEHKDDTSNVANDNSKIVTDANNTDDSEDVHQDSKDTPTTVTSEENTENTNYLNLQNDFAQMLSEFLKSKEQSTERSTYERYNISTENNLDLILGINSDNATSHTEDTTISLEDTTENYNSESQAQTTAEVTIPPQLLGTSTTTEISLETEICYRGQCVKTKKSKASDLLPVE